MNIEAIKELIAAGEHGQTIGELQNGRVSPMPEVQNFIGQLNPQGHKVMDPAIRHDKWVRNQENETTDTPTDYEGTTIDLSMGQRRKGYHLVPVERVALALQRLIVERAVSFAFGNPVDYSATPAKGSKEQDVFNAVIRVLRDVKARSADRRIARAMFTTTEVAELWYAVKGHNSTYGFESEYKLRMAVFSPANGDTLYPYFDESGDLIAFSRQYHVEDKNKVKHRYFETYMADFFYKWELTVSGWKLSDGYPQANGIGKIPVVYGRQEEVEWASVQVLIERLEMLLSNFADTNDYHASPKIFTTGQIVGWAEKGEAGGVIEGEDGATAQYLSWSQAPEAVKVEIETLLKMIYTITQTPDVSFDNVKGIGAVSGVALKMLFMDAHLKVQTKSEVFDEYLQRRMSIVQAFLSKMNAKDRAFAQACGTLMIEPSLVPYMIADESADVAMLMSATGQKSIASRKTAVQRLGWTDDAEAELEQIEAEEAGVDMEPLLMQTPTDVEDGNTDTKNIAQTKDNVGSGQTQGAGSKSGAEGK